MIVSNFKKKQGDFFLQIDSLVVDKPGIYGLIGPNGCGKTTTLRLIAGVLPPDSGAIDYQGLAPRDITMLPQKPYFINDTVYNNLIYPLKIRGIKPDQEKCAFYLEKIGFASRRKQKASSLSSGEQQKLALARAMIFEPKMILVDEGLTDLDIDSLDMFEQMILDSQKVNKTIWIIISHHLPQIQRLCSYIFFMSCGGMEVQGPAEEILLHPQNTLLKKYLKHETIGVKPNVVSHAGTHMVSSDNVHEVRL